MRSCDVQTLVFDRMECPGTFDSSCTAVYDLCCWSTRKQIIYRLVLTNRYDRLLVFWVSVWFEIHIAMYVALAFQASFDTSQIRHRNVFALAHFNLSDLQILLHQKQKLYLFISPSQRKPSYLKHNISIHRASGKTGARRLSQTSERRCTTRYEVPYTSTSTTTPQCDVYATGVYFIYGVIQFRRQSIIIRPHCGI